MSTVVDQEMPPEFGKAMLKKIINCHDLIESVDANDQKRLCDVLISCAMTDMQVIRYIPNLDQIGVNLVIDKERETELGEKIQKICAKWQKQK